MAPKNATNAKTKMTSMYNLLFDRMEKTDRIPIVIHVKTSNAVTLSAIEGPFTSLYNTKPEARNRIPSAM